MGATAVSVGGTFNVTSTSTFDAQLNAKSSVRVEGSLGISETGGNANRLNISSSSGGAIISQIDNSAIIFQTDSGNERLRCRNTAAGAGVLVTGPLDVTGDITAFYASDKRLKDNITPIPNSLEKVNALSGNTYTWNEKSEKEGLDIGVIAQEVQEVLPEAVRERDNGYLAVDYHKITPLLIESIKELTHKVETLENIARERGLLSD